MCSAAPPSPRDSASGWGGWTSARGWVTSLARSGRLASIAAWSASMPRPRSAWQLLSTTQSGPGGGPLGPRPDTRPREYAKGPTHDLPPGKRGWPFASPPVLPTGIESGCPARLFKDFFWEARQVWLPVTVQAGETVRKWGKNGATNSG